MKKILFFSVILVLSPFFVSAHGASYLEFNPDQSNSLRVVDVGTPSQVFFAQNDFLGGADFWVANPGAAGLATFTLFNEQGVALTSKTVSIPTLAETANGTRLHVDFNSQLPVLASAKYSISITSSMSELRLYYSDRVQLVSYNAPPVSEYITGVGKLGSEEQVFSFKYVLYETKETSAPIISNVGWSVISPDEMRINFNTNEAVDRRIEYGVGNYSQVIDFLGDYQFCTQGMTSCNINIPVLPDSTYQYRLTVKDTWGNQSQMTGTFTSGQGQTPAPTPTPTDESPVISNLRIVDVTNNSVSVAWTTNEIANSSLIIRYSGFILIAAVSDSTFELEHYLEIQGGLSGDNFYSAEAVSNDLGNNRVAASISFQTLGAIPSPSPTPTPSPSRSPLPSSSSMPTPPLPTSSVNPTVTPQVNSPAVPKITTSSSPSGDGTSVGTVQWGAPVGGEPKDGYRVDVFDKDGSFVKTILLPKGSNSAEIPGLEKGDYKVIVYENNGGVFKKIDKPAELKIGEQSFLKRLLAFWPYLLIAVGLLVGLLIWNKIKNKPSQTLQSPVS